MNENRKKRGGITERKYNVFICLENLYGRPLTFIDSGQFTDK